MIKKNIIQLLVVLVFSIIGILYGLIASIEAPSEVVELAFLFGLGFSSSIWLLGYLIYSAINKDYKLRKRTIILYSIIISPLIVMSLHRNKFNSEEWKIELSENNRYGVNRAHLHGEMVEDIIKSGILIGKNLTEVENLLGIHYDTFPRKPYSEYTMEIYYVYDNPQLLSGCDKLFVVFEQDSCIRSYKGGCD